VLGHQEPVEGIAVVERQVADRPHLRARDGDLVEAELVDDPRQVVGSAKHAGRALDRDLPQADVDRA